jgi:hypothetical protein
VVLEHEVRLVQETTDEGALAVVDRSAGDETEQRLVLVRLEVGLDVVFPSSTDPQVMKRSSDLFWFASR